MMVEPSPELPEMHESEALPRTLALLWLINILIAGTPVQVRPAVPHMYDMAHQTVGLRDPMAGH